MLIHAFDARAFFLAIIALVAGLTLAEADSRQVRVLPASITGIWGWSVQSCRSPGDDGRVKTKSRSVEFFASTYKLKTIVARASGAFRASAITHEEGEPGTSRGNIDLALAAPGRLSIRTDAAGSHTYVRCP